MGELRTLLFLPSPFAPTICHSSFKFGPFIAQFASPVPALAYRDPSDVRYAWSCSSEFQLDKSTRTTRRITTIR